MEGGGGGWSRVVVPLTNTDIPANNRNIGINSCDERNLRIIPDGLLKSRFIPAKSNEMFNRVVF